MSDRFSPRLDILPAPQRRLWSELSAVPRALVLYGGTAIALHLGHRQSEDFEFFGNRMFDAMAPITDLTFLLAHATTIQSAPNTPSAIVDRGGPVRISFFGLPLLARIAAPLIAPDNDLQVATLIDLAATKAAVVQQRAEARDYIDIDAILRDGRIDLATVLVAARTIYGRQFNPQLTLNALSYFADGNLPHLPAVVKDRLAKAAARWISIACRRSREDRRKQTSG